MKYAYKNGKILNGTKDMQVQTGLIILTEGEKIAAIVPEETRLSGYTEIDLQGKYIMPGLINMHVHLAGNGKPQKKQRDNAKLVKTLMSNRISRAIAYRMVAGFAKDELLSGVTTIRTVGGLGTFDTRLRDEIKAGKTRKCQPDQADDHRRCAGCQRKRRSGRTQNGTGNGKSRL